jgi:hypothetical protein
MWNGNHYMRWSLCCPFSVSIDLFSVLICIEGRRWVILLTHFVVISLLIYGKNERVIKAQLLNNLLISTEILLLVHVN